MSQNAVLPPAVTTDVGLESEPRKIGPALDGKEKVAFGVRRALASEAAGWRSIGRLLTGRRRVPRGASAHRYDRPFRTILIVLLVLSLIEVPIVDLVTHRWPAVRFPLLALGIWGVFTMLGMLANFVTRPHSVGPEGIRLRNGGDVDLNLPWDVIASVAPRRRSLGGAPALSLTGPADDQTLHHVAQDGTDIDIVLEGPTELTLPQGTITVSRVHISVDDTASFLEAVRTHIP